MARRMSCRDVGPDCDFVARGESDEEVLGQVAEHARSAHGMEEVPPELLVVPLRPPCVACGSWC